MVRRRAGELPLESIETKNIVLLSRGNKLASSNSVEAAAIRVGGSPLLAQSSGVSTEVHAVPLGSPLVAHPALSYTTFLGIALVLFVCYLILPKGFRFQYCHAERRRYAKSKGSAKDIQAWVEATTAAKNSPKRLSDVLQQRRFMVQDVLDSRDEGDKALRRSPSPLKSDRQASPVPPSTSMKRYSSPTTAKRSVAFDSPTGRRSFNTDSTIYGSRTMSASSESINTGGGHDKYTNSGKVSLGSLDTKQSTGTSYTPKTWGSSLESPPSPKHPAISGTPTDHIVEETMERLSGRGIRLIAHGVTCDAKRVWIRLDQDTTSVTWQTEFPRRVPTVTGDVSIVLMRGSLHKIALPNVLYIDVGKKTTALKKRENANISDSLCFSLLTQNGSLDLQANSLLERDSLVACFSMVLDSIHSQDWRKLYEESPPPSQVISSPSVSSASGHIIPSDFVEV